jgi:hypothetical protein
MDHATMHDAGYYALPLLVHLERNTLKKNKVLICQSTVLCSAEATQIRYRIQVIGTHAWNLGSSCFKG